MSNTRVKCHPTLGGLLVREDGCIFLPQSGVHPAHWTFGCDNGRGYLRVRVAGRRFFVHRLVLETFVGPAPKDRPEADHIDRNPANNHVSNLRWTDRKGNNRNTSKNDRVDARGWPHTFEDRTTYSHNSCKQYYGRNRTGILEQKREYRKANKLVAFSDGSKHWVPLAEAELLLKIPLKQRIFNK